MESIIELVNLLSRNKLDQIDLIGSNSDSLTNKLFEAIKSNDVSTDAEAADLLYSSEPNSYKYRKLKSRFRKKLLSSLFFIDTSKAYSLEIERAFHQCVKNYAAVSLLITKAARKTAVELVEKSLIEANKYEFTEIAFAFCRILANHYGQIEKNESKYIKYTNLLNEKLETLNAEILAEKIIYQTLSKSLDTKSKNEFYNSPEFKENVSSIKKIIDKYSTHTFLRNAYKVLFLNHIYNNEYVKLIDLTNKAVTRIESKPYETKNIRFSFHLYSILGNLQTSNYQAAREICKEYVKTFNEGSYNWFVSNYYYFISCMHDNEYNLSYKITYNIKSNKNFDKLPSGFRQNWLVNEAYIQFLAETGKINSDKIKDTKSNFRIYRFLNEIPIYSKDKRGLNISILIVHVLFLLHKNKKGEIIDRVDALNQYCHRYLRKDETYRSNCFIKMLLQAPKADFNKIRTKRYAEKYYEKLLENPIDISEQGVEIEIIPYEILWDITLELLD